MHQPYANDCLEVVFHGPDHVVQEVEASTSIMVLQFIKRQSSTWTQGHSLVLPQAADLQNPDQVTEL